ncbi:LamG domain-containing protein [Streptomyces sp. LP05-1]|uniref:LamG domain-containing protein n=1 Tax=Streptomyces pyxinae TaxID=2970734 RepID=A0ABT2CP62_9ACTN|nr:LamG-like jellyroll fold domain-containing protein [Streptomyces sp. LP05-1]MCS0639223.1 LamG domain-containing protein [Streptomyces sp. LP05-1]
MPESARAAETGEPVEVLAERTAYSTTLANPDGTFTLTQHTTPQRSKAADGSWRPVDVTLERRPDGTVGPRSAAVDLAFPGGGDRNAIRLGDRRGSVSLGWAAPLPEPRLDGATATYQDVYEGVDLRLTATAEGYREVLVVKTPEAAARPELDRISLATRGDGLNLEPGAGGGVRAVDANGNAVFAGAAGLMWDSAGDRPAPAPGSPAATTPGNRPATASTSAPGSGPASTPAAPGARAARTAPAPAAASTGPARPAAPLSPGPGGDPGDAPAGTERPGEGDSSAVLPVTVGDGTVSVVPDPAVLHGADTVYPVYIDPPMGLALSERTVLSSDGDRFYDFDGDLGVGNCSRLGPWYCDKNHTNRMYFEFAPTNLAGKQVVDAVFRAYETWSFSCNPQPVELWRTNNISEGSSWPGPARLDHMGDRDVSAGRGEYCSPEQPDSWVEFHDNPAESDENLTATVRAFADGKFPRLTLMLAAKNENDPDAWKRFDDNAALQITYVPKPGLPTPYGVIPGNGTMRYCNPSNDPLVVTTPTPRVQAGTQTLVQPASNGFKGSLKARFDAERYDPADKAWVHTWDGQSASFRPDGYLETLRMTNRADQILYRVRMRTQSYWTVGGTTSFMSSAATPWCYFKTDTTAPKPPRITTDGLYRPCDSDDCPGTGGPGRAGAFTFRPNAADVNATTGATDITGYRYRLLTQTGATTVTGANPPARPVTPGLAGVQVLSVEAKDVRERWGEPEEFVFKVAPPQGATGRWQFADRPAGTTTGTTTRDTATEGTVRHPATLAGGAGWSERSRRGAGDHALDLSGTDPARQQAYAATTEPAVNTADSFTVSAWAYLADPTTNHVVLSAPGGKQSAFTLSYSSGHRRWAFSRAAQDTATTTTALSLADTLDPPTGVWTQLTGVFDARGTTDAADDTIQLFVNGRPQGRPVRLAATAAGYQPWASTEGLQIGRAKVAGTYQQYFRGYLDEVAVWQEARGADLVREDAELREDETAATALVGRWNAEGATGTQVRDTSGYARAPLTLSATGARLATGDDGTELLLDGTAGHATAAGPVVDETASFTVTAAVRLDSALLAKKPVGARSYVLGRATATGGESAWALWAEKVSADGYRWYFGRTSTDAAGKVVQSVAASAEDPAELDTWVQLTGVFDAADPAATGGRGGLRLHLGAAQQVTDAPSAFTDPSQGTGSLTVGRGTALGTTGHHLPGAVGEVRLWAGAMNTEQIQAAVLNGGSG